MKTLKSKRRGKRGKSLMGSLFETLVDIDGEDIRYLENPVVETSKPFHLKNHE